jgi:hypothetical protein
MPKQLKNKPFFAAMISCVEKCASPSFLAAPLELSEIYCRAKTFASLPAAEWFE